MICSSNTLQIDNDAINEDFSRNESATQRLMDTEEGYGFNDMTVADGKKIKGLMQKIEKKYVFNETYGS